MKPTVPVNFHLISIVSINWTGDGQCNEAITEFAASVKERSERGTCYLTEDSVWFGLKIEGAW